MGCFSLSLAAQGMAAQLFKAPSKSVALQKSGDKTILRQRMVKIDLNAMAAAIHGSGDDRSAGRAAKSMALGGQIDLDLFDGLRTTLTRSGVSESPEGGIVWNGAATGEGYAALSIANGTIVGVIETQNRTFLIDPAGDGNHVLREIRASAFKRDKHIPRPRMAAGETAAPKSVSGATRTGPTYIDLLFAYTSGAEGIMTGGGATIEQTLDRDVAIVNVGMKNSGIPIVVRRKGIRAVSDTYNENAGESYKPLLDITSGSNANFPSIRNTRNAVNADLVVLYMRQQPTNYCGVAWVNTPKPLASYGFAAVDTACLGTVTLAHELGHTMGLNHDRYVENKAGTSVFNYGYVSTGGDFRDIMSYPDKCYDRKSRDCVLKTYYSSPKKYYNGRRAGKPQGTKGAADATRWLKRKRDRVSGFR